MCKTFIEKIIDLFEGQIMTREIAAKIEEMRRQELNQLEQELKNNLSASFSKRN